MIEITSWFLQNEAPKKYTGEFSIQSSKEIKKRLFFSIFHFEIPDFSIDINVRARNQSNQLLQTELDLDFLYRFQFELR